MSDVGQSSENSLFGKEDFIQEAVKKVYDFYEDFFTKEYVNAYGKDKTLQYITEGVKYLARRINLKMEEEKIFPIAVIKTLQEYLGTDYVSNPDHKWVLKPDGLFSEKILGSCIFPNLQKNMVPEDIEKAAMENFQRKISDYKKEQEQFSPKPTWQIRKEWNERLKQKIIEADRLGETVIDNFNPEKNVCEMAGCPVFGRPYIVYSDEYERTTVLEMLQRHKCVYVLCRWNAQIVILGEEDCLITGRISIPFTRGSDKTALSDERVREVREWADNYSG